LSTESEFRCLPHHYPRRMKKREMRPSRTQAPRIVPPGALVHYLDVGGIPVPEAPGLAAIVSGVRALQPNDDALLGQVNPVLDSLYRAYSNPDG
jgi:hypothetical protein